MESQRGRRLDPEVRRNLIIEAALRVFGGRDPADVTFEEIADAAGVSRALVYNYFGDRGGLLAAVFLRCFDDANARVNQSLDPTVDPAERVRTLVHDYLAYAKANPAGWRLLQQAGAMDHAAVQAARRRRMEEVASWLGGTPAARLVAYGLVGLLETATQEWLRTGELDVEELSPLLYELIWHGLPKLADHGVTVAPATSGSNFGSLEGP